MAESLSRRSQRKEETKERIFRATIELVSERGLENVTIEQITERADVGKGTFFNYFPSKEAVVTYFGGLQVERLQQAHAAGEITGTPRERVECILEIMAEYPEVSPSLGRGLFVSALRTDRTPEVFGPNLWHVQAFLAEAIRDGQLSGEFRTDRSAEEAGLFMFGQYLLGLLAWCSGFTELSLKESVKGYVSLGIEGLAARQ